MRLCYRHGCSRNRLRHLEVGMTDRSSPITPKEFYDLSGPELLDYCGADASKWARAFCRIKEAQGWSADDVDMSLMTTWFANAIEHSSQVRASLQPASPTACPTDDPSWPESQPCTVCGAFGPWFDTPQNGECASPASQSRRYPRRPPLRCSGRRHQWSGDNVGAPRYGSKRWPSRSNHPHAAI
jgi:hypothetical protein